MQTGIQYSNFDSRESVYLTLPYLQGGHWTGS